MFYIITKPEGNEVSDPSTLWCAVHSTVYPKNHLYVPVSFIMFGFYDTQIAT